jgi:transposase
MRTIGLDLSIKQPSEAIVAGHDGSFIDSSFKIDETAAGLKSLMERAREGMPDDESLRVIMEPTANAWLPIAIYMSQRGVVCHLVQSEKAADLRKFYRKHAKSDRIDTRVLAKIPFVDEEGLSSLYLPTAEEQALRRLCRQREKLVSQASAIKNRLHDLSRSQQVPCTFRRWW